MILRYLKLKVNCLFPVQNLILMGATAIEDKLQDVSTSSQGGV